MQKARYTSSPKPKMRIKTKALFYKQGQLVPVTSSLLLHNIIIGCCIRLLEVTFFSFIFTFDLFLMFWQHFHPLVLWLKHENKAKYENETKYVKEVKQENKVDT